MRTRKSLIGSTILKRVKVQFEALASTNDTAEITRIAVAALKGEAYYADLTGSVSYSRIYLAKNDLMNLVT
jgi:hypothetical protein